MNSPYGTRAERERRLKQEASEMSAGRASRIVTSFHIPSREGEPRTDAENAASLLGFLKATEEFREANGHAVDHLFRQKLEMVASGLS